MHCEEGTGNCVDGTPAPTRTRTSTQRPTATPTEGTFPCDPSCPPANCAPDGTCILTSRSGGCSTTNGTTTAADAVGLMLVPVALWLIRRQRTEQRLALVRARSADRVDRK
jgi:hypothetical protein